MSTDKFTLNLALDLEDPADVVAKLHDAFGPECPIAQQIEDQMTHVEEVKE